MPLLLALLLAASAAPADDQLDLPDLPEGQDEAVPLDAPAAPLIAAEPILEPALDGATESALAEVGGLYGRGMDLAAHDAALALVDHADPRVRAAAWMALGVIERERRHPDAAMAALDEVRRLHGPLEEIATWELADLASTPDGSDLRAIEVCEAYREAWPRGRHAADCLAVLALAYAHVGRADEARNAGEAWRRAARRESIDEQVELAIAEHTIRDGRVDEAMPALRTLATRFTSPQVGAAADRWLGELERGGAPIAPWSLAELEARALSLRDAGLVDAAWDAWLAVRASGEPGAAAWLDLQATSFAWGVRQWDELERTYRDRFAAQPSADLAWDAWRAASRGGRYAAARDWMRLAQERWPTSGRWTSSTEMVGRTLLIGGDYDEAAAWFSRLASPRGATGRRNLLLVGFARMLSGRDAATALACFDELALTPGDHEVEAHYWRARLMASFDPDLADADRAWVTSRAPDSWYALLLRRPDWGDVRDGRMPRVAAPVAWIPTLVDSALTPHALRRAAPWLPAGGPAWLRLAASPWPDDGPVLPDSGYPAGPYHDPDAARAAFVRFADAWSARWPELAAVADLARAGMYDLSGPLFAALYDELRASAWRRDRAAQAALAQLSPEARLPLFVFTRDHHHTARDTVGLQVGLSDDARLATERLQLPLAYPRPVWRHAQRAGLDPLLVLSIMRAESTYNANAVSRAGARGPMQILPRTGHLLASLGEGDPTFTARSLHDPAVAVAYGIRYLGLLTQRFEGVTPLAIAAYNAGPHNVSAWMEGMGRGTPLDVFTEAIPFVETRNYVRKVLLAYDRYVTLHGPPDARVVLPAAVAGDRPAFVDF